MPGAGQRHIGEPPFVGVQSAAVFLALRQIQAGRVHAFHIVDLQGTQGSEHLIVNGLRIVQAGERLDRVAADECIMRESRQDAGVHTHGNGHGGGILQPGLGGFGIFRRRPFAVVQSIEVFLVDRDVQRIALAGRERAVGHAYHGYRIPFEAFRLMHGHKHHVNGRIGCGGIVIGCVAQRIHP